MTKAELLATHFTDLHSHLPPLPEGVEWLLPLQTLPETGRVFRQFLEKYYADEQPRTLILGINPGRFGGGITNVAFTDPVHLERECGIISELPKREELSAQFVHRVIHAFGGLEVFYRQFYISSVVPFGFVKGGVNYNYYDEKPLQEAMTPFALHHLRGLLALGMNPAVCYCLGEGKNFKFLDQLNKKEKLFGKVVPLAHPRFILQYRRKRVEEYVENYLMAFRERATFTP